MSNSFTDTFIRNMNNVGLYTDGGTRRLSLQGKLHSALIHDAN